MPSSRSSFFLPSRPELRRAGFTPAWSYVPASLRAHLAAESGGVLFLPARTPDFYRYRSGAAVANGNLRVTFTNRVRIRAGVWQWTKKTFVWTSRRYPGDCTTFATLDKTLQLSGNKVYWSASAGVAWRCAADARGRQYVLSATSATGLGAGGLASAVASGLDVSRKTSSVTVALTVKPHIVKRGGTVLVSGVAGGCTAGDQVTVSSRAFAGEQHASPAFQPCSPRSDRPGASPRRPGSRPRAAPGPTS